MLMSNPLRRVCTRNSVATRLLSESVRTRFMSTHTKLANGIWLRDAGTAVHELINEPKPTNDTILYYRETPRTSLLMELTDGVGVLHDVLRYFWKYDINVSRIESRPVKDGAMGEKRFDFFVDFDGQRGDANVERLLDSLKPMTDKLLILDEKEVSAHFSTSDIMHSRSHMKRCAYSNVFECRFSGSLDIYLNLTGLPVEHWMLERTCNPIIQASTISCIGSAERISRGQLRIIDGTNPSNTLITPLMRLQHGPLFGIEWNPCGSSTHVRNMFIRLSS
jgi:hypothetical protein